MGGAGGQVLCSLLLKLSSYHNGVLLQTMHVPTRQNFTLYVYLQQKRIFSLAVSGSEHDSCFLKSILPVI